MADDDGFLAFVTARQGELVRLGWALTGERQLGEDLAQTALQRLWPRWDQVSASGEPLAYTHRIMINLWSTWRGRRWRQMETVSADPPETASSDLTSAVDGQHLIDPWLNALPPRQRAVVILRFLFDHSVEETASRLGCTTGTVKSQTSKALHALRGIAGPTLERIEERSHDRR